MTKSNFLYFFLFQGQVQFNVKTGPDQYNKRYFPVRTRRLPRTETFRRYRSDADFGPSRQNENMINRKGS